MGKNSTTKSPSKKTPTKANLVRGPGGSSFMDCPYCKKSVPAVFGESHKEECAKVNNKAESKDQPKDIPESKKEEEQVVVKKRKVVDDEEVEPTTKKGKKKVIDPVVEEVKPEDNDAEVNDAIDKVTLVTEMNNDLTTLKKKESDKSINEVKAKEAAKDAFGVLADKSSTPIEIKGTIFENLTEPSWLEVLAPEFKKPYIKEIVSFLDKEKAAGKTIFPPTNEIFTAYNLTPFDKVKAVIIGQDPYHGAGQAHGLCFSVKKGVNPPPSLKNIYKELKSDISGFEPPSHGNLEKWAKQGVLMLNATLTVEKSKANAHEKIGWQQFTDATIKAINEKSKNVVFILWGNFAQKKADSVNKSKHLVLKTAHPSPYSADKFYGCRHFSKANEYLKKNGKDEIDWKLDD